jgi:hypothetical protein
MQWMDAKQGRHECTSPRPPGHLPQNQKEQDCRNRVKDQIREMVTTGIQSIELTIQHV